VDFRHYASRPDDQLDLLTGALLIARDAHPGLDFKAQSDKLDQLAAPLCRRHIDQLPAALQARAIGDHLFIRHGFRGDTDNYYDARNSFLNDVIERKCGIPITLAVLFVEVARRAGVRAHGVGFPGHFLARVDDSEGSVIVDPFTGGATLSRRDLCELLKRVAGKMKFQEGMLAPIPARHIVARMLMNLRGIYAAQADYPRLLLVLDRLIDLMPDVTDELRDHGYLCAKLGAPRAAIENLQRYLGVLPNAGDVVEVRKFLARLEQDSEAHAN
jgi:regulator of sirC expression with transglutaminase-like and TPR domain